MTEKEAKDIAIKGELVNRQNPKDIAEKYGVSTAKVYSLKKDLEHENNIDEIVALKDLPTTDLLEAAESAKNNSPELSEDIDETVEKITELDLVSQEFNIMFYSLLDKADKLLRDPDLTPKEWKLISDGISALYANIFGTNSPKIYQDNSTHVSSQRLTMFNNKKGF